MLTHTSEQNYCASFMQLLLPELPLTLQDWRKSYKKKIAYYEREKMVDSIAYDEEKSIYRLQDL